MGTLSHQAIGYLFPMGPFYLLLHDIGVPAWVAAATLAGHDGARGGLRHALHAAHARRRGRWHRSRDDRVRVHAIRARLHEYL